MVSQGPPGSVAFWKPLSCAGLEVGWMTTSDLPFPPLGSLRLGAVQMLPLYLLSESLLPPRGCCPFFWVGYCCSFPAYSDSYFSLAIKKLKIEYKGALQGGGWVCAEDEESAWFLLGMRTHQLYIGS